MMKKILWAIAIVGMTVNMGARLYEINQTREQDQTSFKYYQTKVIQSGKPVVLHFSLEDCSACAAFESSWQAVSQAHQDQCLFDTIKTPGPDQHRLRSYFNIESFPTMVYIDRFGECKGRDIGSIDQDTFEKNVSSLISGRPLTTNAQ